MVNNYLWKDNPTEANVALYDPDVLNECLMHLKYNSPKLTPFCINSASLDSMGKPNLLSYSGNIVKFNCGSSLVPSMSSNSQDVWSLISSHTANTSVNDLYKSFDADSTTYCAIGHLPAVDDPVSVTIQKTTAFKLEYLYLKFASIYNAGDMKSFFVKDASGNVLYAYDNLGAFLDQDEFLIPLHNYSGTKITIGTTSNVNGVNYVNFPSTIKLLDKSQVVSLRNSYGVDKKISKISDITIPSTASQVYVVYLGQDGSTEYLSAGYSKGAVLPASPVVNQVFFLTSSEPCVPYKYNGTSWEEYTRVPIGSVTTNSSGDISAVITYDYNQNGYSLNTNSAQKFNNLNVAQIGVITKNGIDYPMLMQWGCCASCSPNGWGYVTFPVAFPNACVKGLADGANYFAADWWGYIEGCTIVSNAQMYIYNGGDFYAPADWIAIGY